MNPDELPDPMLVEQIAEEMPIKVSLRDYQGAMLKLREKNYSYQDIAKWLTDTLGVAVTRSQVSYIVNASPDELFEEQLEEQEDAEDERHPS